MSKTETRVKLLIVDDEEDFLESSSRALNRRGFEALTARDGATALEMVRRQKFDVVVLDLRMPGIDGEEVFDRIHKDHPFMPVIILTGHGSIPHAFKTSKKGIADYIAKPCDIDALADRIRKATGLAKRHQEQASRDVTTTDRAAVIDVLLVDDEVAILSFLKSVLRRHNMNVTTAENGARALERLKETLIDVAVVDVRMPGMDGLELLKRIKAGFPSVKVILLSGHPSASAALKGIRLGASEYLEKPPKEDDLVKVIRQLCRQRQEDIAAQQKSLVEQIRSRYPD